jgi:hypothetical protein
VLDAAVAASLLRFWQRCQNVVVRNGQTMYTLLGRFSDQCGWGIQAI